MKNIFLLGATGSIGLQTLDIIREHKDKFKLVAFSCGRNIEKAKGIIKEFKPKAVSVMQEEDAKFLKSTFCDVDFYHGEQGLIKIATFEKESKGLLVTAVVGSVGLKPTVEAIKIKRDIAIANKETLVAAGHIITRLVKQYKVSMLPIDSEHSAIFQCLNGEKHKNIEKIVITASGGSFRHKSREELVGVTVEDALNHPNWSMGAKITIDSASMMNKGLEVIEAKWLFDLDYDNIETILHYQSVIHSMVYFKDKSVIAQLGSPDMRVPIIYALNYPDRLEYSGETLDLAKISKLDFKEMDYERFLCLKMAYEAGRKGGNAPCCLNAANEAAVDLFLKGKIEFLQIEEIVRYMLDNLVFQEDPNLDEILLLDKQVKETVYKKFGGE